MLPSFSPGARLLPGSTISLPKSISLERLRAREKPGGEVPTPTPTRCMAFRASARVQAASILRIGTLGATAQREATQTRPTQVAATVFP